MLIRTAQDTAGIRLQGLMPLTTEKKEEDTQNGKVKRQCTMSYLASEKDLECFAGRFHALNKSEGKTELVRGGEGFSTFWTMSL